MYSHTKRHTPLFIALIAVVLISISGLPQRAHADSPSLVLLQDVTDTLDGGEDTYALELTPGQVFSILAWNETEGMDVSVTVNDPSGQEVGHSVEADLNDGVVFIDAIDATDGGTYSVVVSGSTSGEYFLIAVPGYSGMAVWDQFDGLDGEFGLDWTEAEESYVSSGVVDGQYVMELKESGLGWMILSGIAYSDTYVETDMTFDGQGNSTAGLVLRTQEQGSDYAYYIVEFETNGSGGIWAYSNGDYRKIADLQSDVDWSGVVRLGVLLEGYTFRVYLNGQMVGEPVTDPEAELAEGTVGLYAYSGDQPNIPLPIHVTYDNMVMSFPTMDPAPQDTTAEDDSGLDVGSILDQSGASEAGDSSNALPFDLEGKVNRQPTRSLRTSGISLP